MTRQLCLVLTSLAVVGLALAACQADDPTPTPAPTATSVPTATTAPTATAIPPTPTPPPTATPVADDTGSMTSASENGLMDFVERGPYDVGVAEMFFHDPDREFDTWNGQYASDAYKQTLDAVRASGENHIVATRIWYPVNPGDSTRAATFNDLYSANSQTFQQAYQQGAVGQFIWSVGASNASPELMTALEARILNAKWNAPISNDGPFPVIVAAHGLGGTAMMWVTAAGHLASHGYVVVATDFLSDGSLPNAFDSPDSMFAASATARDIDMAYGLILREQKVIPKFYEFFFGFDISSAFGGPPPGAGDQAQGGQAQGGQPPQGGPGAGGPPSLPGMTAAPNGGQLVGDMMAGLFTQRVDDVMTVVDGLTLLSDRDADSCKQELAARGQPQFADAVCGRFTGAFDMSKIGVMGHSLGSMTAQFAVAREPRVTAAVGYNNGPPQYWEPDGIFGDGTAADGQPAGNPNPVMQIHGSEDAFVQGIFRDLMWNQITAAGGDPTQLWMLEQEQVVPTDENPQPIARNAYNRATGHKAIILVKDVTHGSLVENAAAELISEHAPLNVGGTEYTASGEGSRPRKAVGDAVLTPNASGQQFMPLGWGAVDGTQTHVPAFVRNYYTRSWFDYYLKGDLSGIRFREDPIPDLGVLDVRSEIELQELQ